MGMKHSQNSSRKVSTMTEEQRISSIKSLCNVIEKMNAVSTDDQRFYSDYIIGLAADRRA